MKKEQNISDNLENEAPFLSTISKENSFSIPENYFEYVPEVIIDKKMTDKSFQLSFEIFSWRALAPFIAVVIIFIAIIKLNITKEDNTLTYDQLSEYIITNNYFEFDNDMIYEAYAETIEIDEYINSETDEYINYLIENDININSIIDEL